MKREEVIASLNIKSYFETEHPYPIKWNGSGWGQTKCHKHDDSTPSEFVNEKTGGLHCKGCDYKASLFDYHMEKYGLDFPSAVNDLAKRASLHAGIEESKKKIIKTYDYTDAEGNLVFQCVRYEPKDFRQRRPDPNNQGKWIYNLQGVQLVPYNLPQVTKSGYAFVVEGEKDVENLRTLGFVASCNPMGLVSGGLNILSISKARRFL